MHNSNYVAGRPLKVIVHGWNSNGNSGVNILVRDAFLAVQDCNVIVVDWRALANSLYATAVIGVPSVGQHLGNFLVWLINTGGGNWNNVHLVGFSLGAHVVGNAGRQSGRRASRVTGKFFVCVLVYKMLKNVFNAAVTYYEDKIQTRGSSLCQPSRTTTILNKISAILFKIKNYLFPILCFVIIFIINIVFNVVNRFRSCWTSME